MKIKDKELIMDQIRQVVPFVRRRTKIQYSIRCPFCGDSKKDPNDSHCYIKFSQDESEPLLWKCFLCNLKGKVNQEFLDAVGVKKDLSEILQNDKANKIKSLVKNPIDIVTGEINMNSLQVKYIEHRLGPGLTFEDYNKFRIVADIGSLMQYISSNHTKNMLPSNLDSISFLTDDKAVLLTRLFEEDGEIRWKKTTLMYTNSQSFYAIQATLNLFTQDDITVNIAEGIIDVISAYKNFNAPNSVFFGALGSDYIEAINYIIMKGFVGTNVIVKIYIDDDQNEKSLINTLKKFKWMFKSIYVYRNLLAKDIGVKIEKIKLEERKV